MNSCSFSHFVNTGRARFILTLIFFIFLAPESQAQVAAIKYVVIIGVDGLTSRGIMATKASHINKLKQDGAYTLRVRAVRPTVSFPNWASLLMGATPDQHGVGRTGRRRRNYTGCAGFENSFPTIYSVVLEQRPQLSRAFFTHWKGLEKMVEGGKPETKKTKNGEKAVENAVEFFEKRRPNLTFVYIEFVDHAGHEFGYDSKEYFEALGKADKLIGKIIDGLHKTKMFDHAAILIVTDHGGIGKSHGHDSPEERETPWILSGAGIKKGIELTGNINIYDIAPTIAYIFGVKPHPCWIGTPVLEAFEQEEQQR